MSTKKFLHILLKIFIIILQNWFNDLFGSQVWLESRFILIWTTQHEFAVDRLSSRFDSNKILDKFQFFDLIQYFSRAKNNVLWVALLSAICCMHLRQLKFTSKWKKKRWKYKKARRIFWPFQVTPKNDACRAVSQWIPTSLTPLSNTKFQNLSTYSFELRC